jgi:hypothetical protein
VQHPFADRDDECRLCDGDEIGSGGTMPRLGWAQRSKASNPLTWLVLKLTSG